jgi:hypothetical protein
MAAGRSSANLRLSTLAERQISKAGRPQWRTIEHKGRMN